MQEFIRRQISIREKTQEKQTKKCLACGRDEKDFFRNFMNTLECMCGAKFYGR